VVLGVLLMCGCLIASGGASSEGRWFFSRFLPGDGDFGSVGMGMMWDGGASAPVNGPVICRSRSSWGLLRAADWTPDPMRSGGLAGGILP